MQTYQTKEIAHALGIKTRWLTSLVDRGLLPGERGGGTGNHRMYTSDEIVRLALLTKLTELGIGTTRASIIAGQFYLAHGLLLVTPTDAVVHPREECAIPSAAILIDLDTLHADVDERLAAVA